mgnify:CR=1 FL=1
MSFDIPTLRHTAQEFVKKSYDGENPLSLGTSGSPSNLKDSLVEDRVSLWLYAHVADQIRIAMQDVLCQAKILNKKMSS